MRRPSTRLAIAGLAIVGLALTGCAGSGGAAASGGTIRLGHTHVGSEFPIDIVGWGLHRGIVQGALAEAGIDKIESKGVPTGPDLNDALNSGSIDLVSYSETPAITARAAGTPTRLIGFTTVKGRTIVVTRPDGPKTIQDLQGAKIATVIGSVMHRVTNDYLLANGVTAEFVSGGQDAVPLLESGSVQAIATWPYIAKLQALQRDEGYPLLWDSDDYPDYAYSGVFVATDDLVEKYPGVPAAWREAVRLSLEDARANLADFEAWYAEVAGIDVELVPDFYELSRVSSGSAEETEKGRGIITQAQKSGLRSGAITSEINVDEWWAE